MGTDVQFFGSIQSPYCYFSLNRLEELTQECDINLIMRPVLPGVIRIADAFIDRSDIELAYFDRDVPRTADFLNLPYADANPSPVNWLKGAGWIAAPDQSRVYYIYNLLYQAHLLSEDYALYAALMRLIWSGNVVNWDEKEHILACLSACNLPETLIDQPDTLLKDAEIYFAANQTAMFTYGHWGVPTYAYNNEPFYGQDRLDQLKWRILNNQ